MGSACDAPYSTGDGNARCSVATLAVQPPELSDMVSGDASRKQIRFCSASNAVARSVNLLIAPDVSDSSPTTQEVTAWAVKWQVPDLEIVSSFVLCCSSYYNTKAVGPHAKEVTKYKIISSEGTFIPTEPVSDFCYVFFGLFTGETKQRVYTAAYWSGVQLHFNPPVVLRVVAKILNK